MMMFKSMEKNRTDSKENMKNYNDLIPNTDMMHQIWWMTKISNWSYSILKHWGQDKMPAIFAANIYF